LVVSQNYDSFVYNLVQYLGELGADPAVYRNDVLSVDDALGLDPDAILISPGPGRPEGAGISMDLIAAAAGKVPVFGVCLGLQCIGQLYGGEIVLAPEQMHGKTSEFSHSGQGVFRGLPSPLRATRYHSLIVDADSVPEVLEITAQTNDGIVMGLRHTDFMVEGVQFHPESVLTEAGHQLLRNFLDSVRESSTS